MGMTGPPPLANKHAGDTEEGRGVRGVLRPRGQEVWGVSRGHLLRPRMSEEGLDTAQGPVCPTSRD